MPVWQELREELKHKNFEVITVGCDVKGAAAEEQWIRAANPTHPSLIDERHLVPELYNTRNVPTTVWINEDGQIVRFDEGIYLRRRNRETGEFTVTERYLNALRDWAAKGSASGYVLSAEEAQARLRQPATEDAQATVHFRLGAYLVQQGHAAEAVAHFKQAHALKPENWNMKRQAFNLGNPEQDYGTTMQQETQIRPSYVPLDMPALPEA